MRLSRLSTALLAGVSLWLGWPAGASAEWLFHPYRRPFQWLEPGTPETTATTPEVKTTPTTPATPMPEATPEPPVSPSPLVSAALGDSFVAVAAPGGYIDSAIPRNTFRLRYDAGTGMNRPDRGTFFYSTWSELSFHPHAVVNSPGKGFFDGQARGPVILPATANYQEVS